MNSVIPDSFIRGLEDCNSYKFMNLNTHEEKKRVINALKAQRAASCAIEELPASTEQTAIITLASSAAHKLQSAWMSFWDEIDPETNAPYSQSLK